MSLSLTIISPYLLSLRVNHRNNTRWSVYNELFTMHLRVLKHATILTPKQISNMIFNLYTEFYFAGRCYNNIFYLFGDPCCV